MTGMWTNSQDGPWLLECVREIAQISQVNKGGGSLDGHSWTSMRASKRRETSTLGRMGENSQAILLARSYPLLIRGGPAESRIAGVERHSRTVGVPRAGRMIACSLASSLPSPLQSKIGSGEAVVHCACRTSTVSSCAFHEQEGRLTAPYLPIPASFSLFCFPSPSRAGLYYPCA